MLIEACHSAVLYSCFIITIASDRDCSQLHSLSFTSTRSFSQSPSIAAAFSIHPASQVICWLSVASSWGRKVRSFSVVAICHHLRLHLKRDNSFEQHRVSLSFSSIHSLPLLSFLPHHHSINQQHVWTRQRWERTAHTRRRLSLTTVMDDRRR